MAKKASHTLHKPRWRLSPEDVRYLGRRFRQDLLAFLEDVRGWRDSGNGTSGEEFESLADKLEEARRELDICAANCHSLAATLRAYSNGDSSSNPSPKAGIRLEHAMGRMVILTHTTIEHLAGKSLTLEYIDGPNAIVQIDGEYWGTPLDRVLVLPENGDAENHAPETAADDDAKSAAKEPSFRFSLKPGEISNVIQFLTMTSRTGMLSVSFSAGTARGSITFAGGRVLNAVLHEFRGIEAVAHMMNLDHAEARFHDDEDMDRSAMQPQLSTEQLLIESAVRADEIRAENAT